MMRRTTRLSCVFVCGLSAFVLSSPALAAEEAGLPQLDPTWFASQVFWLVVHFALLYIIASKLILPRVGKVLGERATKVAGDLQQAEALQQEATTAQTAYEAALQAARTQAQASREQVKKAAEADRVAAEQKLAQDLAAKTDAAYKRIADASVAMRAQMGDVAADAAQQIISKVAGLPVDRAAVDAALAKLGNQSLKEVA